MSERTPNYVITESYLVQLDVLKGNKMLEAGSFVRPIHIGYLPSHIRDKSSYNYESSDKCYCFTRFGIILIPKKIIREV